MGEAKRILITGASGLIGKRLTSLLISSGYEVSHLSRQRKHSGITTYEWNVAQQTIDTEAIKNVDAIIHLAGAGVADKRWSDERKKEILESRTQSTALLYKTLKQNPHQVKTVISASAIGYYGFDGNDLYTEATGPGKDFLADVTRQWEAEADKIQELDIRLVKIRIGVVLSKEDGALKPMANTVKAFFGSPLGSGTQQISWIHIDDLCNMFLFALKNDSLKGAYNGVAPNPVSNAQLTKAIAKALRRPLLFPAVPAFVIRVLFGEMSDIVLKGSTVSSAKIQSAGFKYKFEDVNKAVNDLLA